MSRSPEEREDTHIGFSHVRVFTWFSGRHGTSTATPRDASRPRSGRLGRGTTGQGSCGCNCRSCRSVDVGVDQSADQQHRAHGAGHPHVDASGYPGRGAAYRPRIKEGPLADARGPNVCDELSKFGGFSVRSFPQRQWLAGHVLCVFSPGRNPGSCRTSTAVPEVVITS